MNLRAKFVISIGLLGLLCLMLPGSLRADTLYTYTGNPFNSCSGTYANLDGSCSGAVSVTFDVTGNVDGLNNVSGGYISVTSFTFSDGDGLSIGCANTSDCRTVPLYDLFIITNMHGIITYWYMYADSETGNSISTWNEQLGMPGCYEAGCYPAASDEASISDPSEGSNKFDSGSWSGPVTVTTTTPEPSTNLLLGIGLLSLLALAARSKRHAPLNL
jgi:hypothetical protein